MVSLNSSKSGRTKSGTWLIFVFGLLILLIAFLRKSSASTAGPPIPSPTTALVNPEIFVILTNAGYSPQMADWWTAISKYETGAYTSELFRNANNLFGMGVPTVRQSLRSGEYTATDGGQVRQFSKYASTADSVKDLVLYLKSQSYPVTFDSVDQLISFMYSKKYFEQNPATYLAGVKRYL